jgi:glycosyltransferase involved in cell wall biosynthesis
MSESVSQTHQTEAGGPVVSVVIPTYNRANILPRALESALAQTYDHLEVLVVDDGSTDNTAELVAQYAELDNRVRYLRQPQNAGVSAARNRGLREARGDFVAFLDSDDEWFPAKLEGQVERFGQVGENVGLIYCGVETIEGEGDSWTFRPEHRGDVYEHLLLKNVIHTGSGVIIRRNVTRSAGFFDEEIPAIEDYEYWLRIARYYEFDFVEAPLIRYFDATDVARKSLDSQDNHDARAYFYRKHGAEMRKAKTAHLFLLESARRHRAADHIVDAIRLGVQAIFLAPNSYPAYPFLLETVLPVKLYGLVRRFRRAR